MPDFTTLPMAGRLPSTVLPWLSPHRPTTRPLIGCPMTPRPLRCYLLQRRLRSLSAERPLQAYLWILDTWTMVARRSRPVRQLTHWARSLGLPARARRQWWPLKTHCYTSTRPVRPRSKPARRPAGIEGSTCANNIVSAAPAIVAIKCPKFRFPRARL